MARKLSNIPAFFGTTLVLVVACFCTDALAQDPPPQAKVITATSVTDLNNILGLNTAAPRDLLANDTVTFTINIAGPAATPNIVTEQLSMLGTEETLNYILRIQKEGLGTWRLGPHADGTANVSDLWANTENRFAINAGTLELMQGSSITLRGTDADTSFTMGNNTTLNSRGSMALPNNAFANAAIAAPNIILGNGVSLGFDISSHNGGAAVPVLNLDGNVSYAAGVTDMADLNILGFRDQGTQGALETVMLLQYRYAGTAPTPANPPIETDPTYAPPPIVVIDPDATEHVTHQTNAGVATTVHYPGNSPILVRGENWFDVESNSRGRLNGTVFQRAPEANTGGTVLIGLMNFSSNVGIVEWNGNAGNDIWNATSDNWQSNMLAGDHTFLHGDSVTFGGTGDDITIQAGGVQIGRNPGVDNVLHVGMLVNSGVYTFTNAGNSNIGIDGPGNVHITTLTGASAVTDVTFASANSYWGTTTVDNESILRLHNSGGLGTGTLTLRTDAELYLATDPDDMPNDAVFNNIVTEAGTAIYKDNANTLSLEGGVSGVGDVFVREGTLRKGIPQGILTVFENATYETVDRDRSIAGLSDNTLTNTGGTVDMAAYALSINVSRTRPFTFSGLITGAGASIVKNGTGTQIFANDHNMYTGGTRVGQGTLVGQYAMTGDITNYTPFGTGDIQIGPQVSTAGATIFAVLRFDLQADPTLPTPVTAPLFVATLSNTITGAGDVEVGVEDPANASQILHLAATDSSYSGKTTVNSGKLLISHYNATGQTSVVDLRTADTALQLTGAIGSLDTPYDRVISGAGGVEVLTSLLPNTKTEVFLRGSNQAQPGEMSDYTGETTVNANSALHILDGKSTGNTVAVNLVDADSDLYLEFGHLPDENGQEAEQVYDRFITGEGNLIKNGDGTALLTQGRVNQYNNYLGATTINAGSLKLAYADATGAAMNAGGSGVLVNENAILELAFTGLYNKDIAGRGILAKSGEGTISTLAGFSSYTGGTQIYGGTLSYNNLDPLQQGSLGTGGVSFERGGGTLQNRAVVSEFTQQVLIDGGSTATFDTLADLTIAGTSGISHRRIDSSDPYFNADDQLSHFVKSGSGTMTINVLAAWNGSTTVKNGILANNIPIDTALTLEAPGTYFTGNANRQVSALLGAGTVNSVSGYDFIVNNAAESVFDGLITGGGNLVKTNAGTLILNETGTYTGDTHIRQGTLVGGISRGTDLTVDSIGTYQSGGSNRAIASLRGEGVVDMQGRSLTINQTSLTESPKFSGYILDGDQLNKLGAGTQILAGIPSQSALASHVYHFRGNVNIQEGFLWIGGATGATTSFKTDADLNIYQNAGLILDKLAKVDITGNFDIKGTLGVTVGDYPVEAGSVTIGANAVLDISGVSASDLNINEISSTEQGQVVIRSKTAINDDFANVTIGGSPVANVDFLQIGVNKSANKKEIFVGQTLAWYKSQDAHGNFTLLNPENRFTVGLALNDVSGTFDTNVWDGKTLTKKGAGTLVLAVENGYTGQTKIEQGTLKLTHEKATAGSEKIVLSHDADLEIDFNSVDGGGAWTEGLTTSITNAMNETEGGNLLKTGTSLAILGGTHSFTGHTYVNQGTLLLDGSTMSRTWVRNGAAFGGDGTVNNHVTMEEGSHYYWRTDGTEIGSDTLDVTGIFDIRNDVTFKPVVTVEDDELQSFENMTVISTTDGVRGTFVEAPLGLNPFYRYELDYSDPNAVKITGIVRDTPLALSDIVATSLMSAQTRMYRTAYQQIAREWLADCPHQGHGQTFGQQAVRGQAVQGRIPGTLPQRTAWMNFIGRGEDFASTFHNGMYDFQSYGVQTGISLVSNCTQSLGIMYGREESTLAGGGDEVKGEDNYLGFYFGRVFAGGTDVKTYIGGGWQKFDLTRVADDVRYLSRFNGNTFSLNGEFGRRFIGRRNWLIRPFVGMDLSITWVGKSLENAVDAPTSIEYRGYKRSDLTQFLFRVGMETTKSWRRIDFRAGTQFRWNMTDTTPWTEIYYPAMKGQSVRGYAADLGHCEWGINVGMNWFLTDQRNTMFYIDYDADLYFNRTGDPSTGTGTLGFVWRF